MLGWITTQDVKSIIMKHEFILLRRGGVFYCEDTTTRKQTSRRRRDRGLKGDAN